MTDAERKLLSLVIGHRVREARVRQHMAQTDLAHGIGSQSMISLIESGRQLPPDDVLDLIAVRLQDDMLRQYASSLSSGELSVERLSDSNPELLLEILRSHRGKWHDIHKRISLQLCQYFYNNRIFGIVQEICLLIFEHVQTKSILAQSYFYYGSVYLFASEYEEAQSWLLKSESLQSELDVGERGRLYYNLGYLYTTLDFQGMALWYAKHAADQFYELHDFPRHAKSLGLLGVIQGRIGRIDDAIESLELALQIGSKWGIDEIDLIRVQTSLAAMYEASGKCDAAKDLATKTLSSATAAHDDLSICHACQVLFLIYMTEEDFTNAKNSLNKAITTAERTNDSPLLAHIYLLATSYLPTPEERFRAAERAYEVTLSTHFYIEHALAAEGLAHLHEGAGRREIASAYRKTALNSYREYVKRNSMFRSIISHLPTH
jgi:tetratricopeptide (TPR) repeat protein